MYFKEGNAWKIVHRMSWWRSWSIYFNRGGLASSRGHLGVALGNLTRDQNLSNSEEYWFDREILRSPCLRLVLINCSDGSSLCSSDWINMCRSVSFSFILVSLFSLRISFSPLTLAVWLSASLLKLLWICKSVIKKRFAKDVDNRFRAGTFLDLHGNAVRSFEIK